MRRLCAAALWVAAAWPLPAQAPGSAPLRAESFSGAGDFRAIPSDGVALTLRPDSGVVGAALRMDFDFGGRAGYAVARRSFILPPLPTYWAATLWVRGRALANTLELKFVDSSGLNVWWMRRPELLVTGEWTRLRFRASDLSYAWGPLGGGPPRGIAALEIAFTAGQGGAGWLALDELVITPLPAPVADHVRPRVTASSSAARYPAAAVLPADFALAPGSPRHAGGGWRSAGDSVQWLGLDFGGTRLLSGLVIDWSASDWAVAYDIEASDDGLAWRTVRSVRDGASGRRFVHLPGTETTRLRLVMRASSRGRGYAMTAMRVLSDSAAPTRSAFLERLAAASPAGHWPRSLTGQQSYWTVIGLPRDARDALVSEDGAVESRPGGFSVEPLVLVDGRLRGWRDGRTSHSLDGGSLPIPTVRRTTDDLAIAVTAFATGVTAQSIVWVRYRLVNRLARTRAVRLFALVRPVQVNPPWQFLGTPGGAATIRLLRWDGQSLVVNDTDRVVPVTRVTGVGVSAFDAGSIAERLASASALPGATTLSDATGLAEGALEWTVPLRPLDSADVWIALPDPSSSPASAWRASIAPGAGESALDSARSLWSRELQTIGVDLPGTGARLARTLRSALAYVLINSRGPALQPGTRSYRRSWIRDGALTSSALMRMGHAGDARAFLDWYVPSVFPDGKVPCCVDARGADPVTENDADGELLYLAAEHLRITGDTNTVQRHWGTLARVADHLDSLRRSRRTAQYRTSDSLLVFGLLPPSISHEGYSAKPAYSYWDSWWGVRGLDDAALLARTMHDSARGARYAAAGREMRGDVVASVARSMTLFGRAAMPGAAELGDLDPTSSTIALEPAQALDDLPRAAVLATFDSAWATLQRRRAPGATWDIYTPYEWRNVGAYLRLSQPERALAYAHWLLDTQRPAKWNQWSEAVWREPRTPKFIGDMPHGWVLSDFARATLDMIAYERERDSSLVVGAGIPADWAFAPEGVTVRGLRTWWGTLALTMRGSGSMVRVALDGVHPPRGVVVMAPFGRPVRGARVDGRVVQMTNGGRAVVVRAPAIVEFTY